MTTTVPPTRAGMNLTTSRLAQWLHQYEAARVALRMPSYAYWHLKGRPIPPPQAYKIATILRYASQFKTDVFVETGTYLGDTTHAVSKAFNTCHTIELDDALYRNAVRRFSGRGHITPWHGDSANVLPQVLASITQPTLFWLDGHYSAGFTAKGSKCTPIVEELSAILKHPVTSHVVLIDDAREFTGSNDYPTLSQVESQLRSEGSRYRMVLDTDVIRITPTQQ